MDLYNEQYGLLTADDKANLNDFWASLGVDFDRFIERLKEAALDPESLEPLPTRGDDEEEEEKTIFDVIFEEDHPPYELLVVCPKEILSLGNSGQLCRCP